MSETEDTSIGEGNRCGHVIPAGYLYTWCVECRTELPDVVKAKLVKEIPGGADAKEIPGGADAKETPSGERGVRMAVKGRFAPCPLCEGEWFKKRENGELVRSSVHGAAWIRSTGTSYVCLDCGHVISFAH